MNTGEGNGPNFKKGRTGENDSGIFLNVLKNKALKKIQENFKVRELV